MSDDRARAFEPDRLELLRRAKTVRIETEPARGGAPHSAIIWVVVDPRDRVLIRTYRGPSTRWYREALANGRAVILARRERIDVRVEHTPDPDRIAVCSRLLEEKYAGDPATPLMVRDEVLGTTLELHPA
jgi:hypothetical protein